MLQKADAVLLQLHGCVGCNQHVFLPSDRQTKCPKCRHPRFSCTKKPNEVCWYFPLAKQIARLLQDKNYRNHLQHEFRRPTQNENYMTDVYDSPRWRKVAGRMTSKKITRIVLQMCVDAFPWSARKHQVYYIFFLVCFAYSQRSSNGGKFKSL